MMRFSRHGKEIKLMKKVCVMLMVTAIFVSALMIVFFSDFILTSIQKSSNSEDELKATVGAELSIASDIH